MRTTTFNITDRMDEQLKDLESFGTQTDIIRIAVDRLWISEAKNALFKVGLLEAANRDGFSTINDAIQDWIKGTVKLTASEEQPKD